MQGKRLCYPRSVKSCLSDTFRLNYSKQLSYGKSLPTQTSMQMNSSSVVLSPQRSMRVIDIPGHPRLRTQFHEHLSEARAIAFVVDASSISRNGAAVAECVTMLLIFLYVG